jgi:hypothetical protein
VWLGSYHENFLVPLAIRLFRESPDDYDDVVRPGGKLFQRVEAKAVSRETQGRRPRQGYCQTKVEDNCESLFGSAQH